MDNEIKSFHEQLKEYCANDRIFIRDLITVDGRILTVDEQSKPYYRDLIRERMQAKLNSNDNQTNK